MARLFWTREFPGWNERYRTEALSAIQNKVRPFLMNRSIRAIVGQKGRTLNLRKVMDEGKVLVANLSKGRIGEDNANLLGALLVSTLQQAAMSRADVPEEQRRDFFLTVDEFQNYRTGSFASILSEARKYRSLPDRGPPVPEATRRRNGQRRVRQRRIARQLPGERRRRGDPCPQLSANSPARSVRRTSPTCRSTRPTPVC